MAESWGYPFLESSALLNRNVREVFTVLLGSIEKDSGLLEEEPEESCTLL